MTGQDAFPARAAAGPCLRPQAGSLRAGAVRRAETVTCPLLSGLACLRARAVHPCRARAPARRDDPEPRPYGSPAPSLPGLALLRTWAGSLRTGALCLTARSVTRSLPLRQPRTLVPPNPPSCGREPGACA